jgi:hypothetical protein
MINRKSKREDVLADTQSLSDLELSTPLELLNYYPRRDENHSIEVDNEQHRVSRSS